MDISFWWKCDKKQCFLFSLSKFFNWLSKNYLCFLAYTDIAIKYLMLCSVFLTCFYQLHCQLYLKLADALLSQLDIKSNWDINSRENINSAKVRFIAPPSNKKVHYITTLGIQSYGIFLWKLTIIHNSMNCIFILCYNILLQSWFEFHSVLKRFMVNKK